MEHIPLTSLPIGKVGRVLSLNSHRLHNLGIIPGTQITPLHISPAGDPTAYYIRGAVIALRYEDANQITVSEGGYE